MIGILWQKIKSRKKIAILFIVFLFIALTLGKGILFPQAKVLQSTSVKKGYLKQELTLSGKIDAEDHALLQFPSGGKLAWVGVKEGDTIKKGQMIAYLDPEKLQAALRQAEQNFTAAKAEHDKYYDGRDSNASESYDKKIERTAIDAKQNVAYDSLRIAQENVKDATLYSPIEGTVTRVDAPQAGANILPTQVFEIVNPNTIYLSVTADQTDVVNLKQGQKGIVIFDAYPEEKVSGTITTVSFTPRTDDTGTTYEVKLELDKNKQLNKYRLGMTADVTFITEEKHDIIHVPSNYVKIDDKGKYILTGKDMKKTYVKTGLETDTEVEILSGLSEGVSIYD